MLDHDTLVDLGCAFCEIPLSVLSSHLGVCHLRFLCRTRTYQHPTALDRSALVLWRLKSTFVLDYTDSFPMLSRGRTRSGKQRLNAVLLLPWEHHAASQTTWLCAIEIQPHCPVSQFRLLLVFRHHV